MALRLVIPALACQLGLVCRQGRVTVALAPQHLVACFSGPAGPIREWVRDTLVPTWNSDDSDDSDDFLTDQLTDKAGAGHELGRH